MKVKGFTLIEVIVVIAIIAALSAILIPVMASYVKDSKIAAVSANAKNVYSASQTALIASIANNDDIKTVVGGSVYVCTSDGVAKCSGQPDIDMKPYLGEPFTEYFAFKISDDGSRVDYALWSNEPFADTRQLTEEEVGTAPINVGCYPFKD